MSEGIKKAGIIGLGGMGRRHCEALKILKNVELTAVCDLRPEVIDQVAQQYAPRRSYVQWKDLLQREKLDLLIIASNGPSHAMITMAAAECGVPRILCEKPMATSLLDAQRMIEICREKEVRLAINHLRRWVSAYARLKAQLENGVIGEVRHITFEMAGGQLASNGGHLWDLIRFLTGKEPIKVQGFLDKTGAVNPRGAQYNDPGAYGLLWLEGGIRVFFDMSEDYGVPFFMEIMGSVGRVLIDEKANRWEIWARRPQDRNQPMTKRPALFSVPFQSEEIDMVDGCRRIVEELLDDGPISCSGEDGLKSLLVTIGVHESEALGNKIIKLPLEAHCYEKEFQFT